MTPTTTTTADLLATIARLENQIRLSTLKTPPKAEVNTTWQTRCEAAEIEISGLRHVITMVNQRMTEVNQCALNSGRYFLSLFESDVLFCVQS